MRGERHGGLHGMRLEADGVDQGAKRFACPVIVRCDREVAPFVNVRALFGATAACGRTATEDHQAARVRTWGLPSATCRHSALRSIAAVEAIRCKAAPPSRPQGVVGSPVWPQISLSPNFSCPDTIAFRIAMIEFLNSIASTQPLAMTLGRRPSGKKVAKCEPSETRSARTCNSGRLLDP